MRVESFLGFFPPLFPPSLSPRSPRETEEERKRKKESFADAGGLPLTPWMETETNGQEETSAEKLRRFLILCIVEEPFFHASGNGRGSWCADRIYKEKKRKKEGGGGVQTKEKKIWKNRENHGLTQDPWECMEEKRFLSRPTRVAWGRRRRAFGEAQPAENVSSSMSCSIAGQVYVHLVASKPTRASR